jgi:hypothetical protein
MKVTKTYLKQLIKEEMNKMEEGGVAIGSTDDSLAQMGYDKKGPEFASQTGMLKAVSDYTITQIVKALGALQKGDSERVENILQDTVKYLDTKLTGLEPNRMSPKMNYK